MPTVPTRQPQQVRERALPRVRFSTQAPAEAFGGGQVAAQTTQAIQGLADTGAKIFAAEKRKADELAVQDAYMAVLEKKNQLLYDPKEGFTLIKGKGAMTSMGDFQAQFTAFSSEQNQTLSNDSQRRAFGKVAARIGIDYDQSLQRHAGSEGVKYDLERTNSALAIAKDDAEKNYQNPNAVKDSINTQVALITDHATRNDKPLAWLRLNTDKAVSGTHVAVLTRMLNNGQDIPAETYFKDTKKEITGSDRSDVEKLLDLGSRLGKSQRIVEDLISRGVPRADALEELNGIDDPKLKSVAKKLYLSEQAIFKKAKQDRDEEIFSQSVDTVEQSKDIRSIPLERWDAMSRVEQSALEDIAERARLDRPPDTKVNTFYSLMTEASNPATKVQFMDKNLLVHYNDLSPAARNKMIALQTSMRKGDAKAQKTLDGFETKKSIVDGLMREMGIDPNDKAVDEATRVNEFRRKVDEMIIEFQDKTGKKVTNTEVRDFANTLATEVVTDRGFFFNTKKRVFEIGPEDSADITFDEIPPEEKRKIESALGRKGVSVTKEAILAQYLKKLKRFVR